MVFFIKPFQGFTISSRFSNRISNNPEGVKYEQCMKCIENQTQNQSTLKGLNNAGLYYHPSIQANIKGATIVASLSTINLGVWISNFPQVIFSLGTAPE